MSQRRMWVGASDRPNVAILKIKFLKVGGL